MLSWAEEEMTERARETSRRGGKKKRKIKSQRAGEQINAATG